MKIKEEYKALISNGFYIIDTETTDLNGEVVQFCLIDENNNVLINEYCKPKGKIQSGAQAIHNISNEQVKNCDTFIPIYEKFLKIICENEKPIFIYNANFDISTMYRSLTARKYFYHSSEEKKLIFDKFMNRSRCVMEDFAKIYGEYNSYFGSYKWQKLENAARYYKVKTTDLDLHNAKTDCYLTLEVIRGIIK